MESVIYNSAWRDLISGRINILAGTVKCMLVKGTYVPDKRSHSRRSHVRDEVVGSGYTIGGMPIITSVEISQVIDRIYLVLGAARWPLSTISAGGAAYYHSRSGAPSDDELIAFLAFGQDAVSINDDFVLSESRLWLDNSNNLIV